jgi:hypothetical protein
MLVMTPPRSLPAEAAAEKPIAPITVRALNKMAPCLKAADAELDSKYIHLSLN